MNAVAETRGAFHLNGGEPHPGILTVTRDIQRLATLGPKADTSWTFRDKAGHFHAYSVEDERYPTLFRVDHPCDSPHLDGDGWWCECWTGWECRICRENIVPGMRPGPHEELVPGLRHWDLTLDCFQGCVLPEVGAMVTVEAAFPRPEGKSFLRFGVAVVSSMSTKSFGDLVNTKALLIGAGPLGEVAKR